MLAEFDLGMEGQKLAKLLIKIAREETCFGIDGKGDDFRHGGVAML